MRKRGLKDVKRRNRQIVVESVMESGGLSRTEISQKTELAASTVSTLVSELLSEGILTEAGSVTTAGRSRTELIVNPRYGCIPVIEIGRQVVYATCFDMSLHAVRTAVLSRRYVGGSELFSLICRFIDSLREDLPPMVGIGLLFQEDMQESDFRVVYSTGFSSAPITLREALLTQYRVSVEEQYSVAYTVTDALARESEADTRNSAHIAVGSRVMASVTLEGKNIPIRSNFCEELCAAIDSEVCTQSSDGKGMQEYIGKLITLLCMLFPLETVFLSGTRLLSEDLEALLQLPQSRRPRLKFIRPNSDDGGSAVMARQVLRKFLIAC